MSIINFKTFLDAIEDPSQVGNEPSNAATEYSVPVDKNPSLEEEGHLVDEGNCRLDRSTSSSDAPTIAIKRVSSGERAIRIIITDEYGQMREYKNAIPEITDGHVKMSLQYKKAGPIFDVQFSSQITLDSVNVAETSSDQVEQEIKTERNEESAAGGSSLKGNAPSSGGPPPKQFQCRDDNCSKSFTSRGAERNHYGSVHMKMKYGCKLCPKTFQMLPGIYKHLRTAHKENCAMTSELKQFFNAVSANAE